MEQAELRATLHGTNTGPWRGRPATGRAIAVEHAFFFRFDGDRITDVWELLDQAELEQQLGG